MTTTLEGGEGSVSHPGLSLPLGKTRYPLYRRLGGPPGWTGAENLAPPGFDPRTVQPLASRYTDYATRPTIVLLMDIIAVWLRGIAFFSVGLWYVLYVSHKLI